MGYINPYFMKCKNCGAENSEEKNFCSVCGFSLRTEQNVANKEYMEDISKFSKDKYESYRKILSHCCKAVPDEKVSPFGRWIAFILCVFLGWTGMHRYYVGKIGTGVLYTLTLGLLGIGALIDAIRIVIGKFTDCEGLFLRD